MESLWALSDYIRVYPSIVGVYAISIRVVVCLHMHCEVAL